MALSKQFERQLQNLFNRRTAWLKHSLGKKQPGRAPIFSKKSVQPRLERLLEVAEESLITRHGNSEFRDLVRAKKQWQVKGKAFGVDAKIRAFKGWYQKYITSDNCIYVFWSRRRCYYVGRTIRGKGRPSAHFVKYWFPGVTRIDIFSVSSPTRVPKAECLAIHLMSPRYNKNQAAKRRYCPACPICKTKKEIKTDLKRLFRIRN